MLLGTLGASLLGNMLVAKGRGISRAGYGSKHFRSKWGGMIRAVYGSKKFFNLAWSFN